MDRLFGSDKPLSLATSSVPPKAGPEIFLLRMKGDSMDTFTVYSKDMYGIWVHWNGKKSEPHFTDEGRCPGCQAKRTKRWKGYLHCFSSKMGQEVFLELTPASAQSLLSQLGERGSLRGNRIQVKRTKGDNGRLLISVLTACPEPNALPKEKDPQESLLKLWGLGDVPELTGREFPTKRPALNGFH